AQPGSPAGHHPFEPAPPLAACLVSPILRPPPLPPADLRAARGFLPSFARPLRWLLERLATAGVLTRAGTAYRLAGPPPRPALAALREDALAMDASYAPAYDLLDAAAALYPGVARGEVQAERALFLRA